MSGANQFTCIFPDNIYKHLSGENVNLTKEDYESFIRKINTFDKCNNRTSLKTKLKVMVAEMGNTETGNLRDKVDNALINDEEFKSLCDNLITSLKQAPFVSGDNSKSELDTEVSKWCGFNFKENYEWLDTNNDPFRDHKDITLNGAKIIIDNFNCMDENGVIVELNDVIFDTVTPGTLPTGIDALGEASRLFTTGGARYGNRKLRLNMLKRNGIPVLFSKFPKSVYLTKRWRGENAEFGSSSSSSSSLTPSNLTECGDKFNSGLDKRHIKAWTPREHGSSASTVNAMSHLRRMATQPRITQVELGSLGPLLARGFMGGSMDGGAQMQLDVDFKDCESGTDGKNLSVRQSTQYATLFKSVVQRLGHHNEVSETVVNELKNDLEDYRRKECKLFQDAFRLANALKSQNNGSLPDKQQITDLDTFKTSTDEVVKSENHLLECLTKILTETCKKP